MKISGRIVSYVFLCSGLFAGLSSTLRAEKKPTECSFCEGYKEGSSYVELIGGFPIAQSGSVIRTLREDQNDPFTGGKFGYTTFLRGNSSQVLLNAAANASAPDLKIHSMHYEFAFEHAVSNLFSIGFALNDTRLDALNVRSNISSDQTVLLGLSAIYPNASNSTAYNDALMNLENLDPVIHTNKTPYVHATTLAFQGKFHPLESFFDPYIGAYLGPGREFVLPSYAWRAGLSVGARIFFTPHSYAALEARYETIYLGGENDGPLSFKKQLNETGINLLFGIGID